MRSVRSLLVTTCLVSAVFLTPLTAPAKADDAPAAAPAFSAQERHDQLARVQEMLTDPDPLMRQANLEAIVKTGDQAQIRIALKIAFASDDKELRALAMRAYLAAAKQIVFEIKLPAQLQKAYDNVKYNPEELAALTGKPGYGFIASLQAWHMMYDISIESFDMNANQGRFAQTTNKERRGTFTVVGDMVQGQGEYSVGEYTRQCQVSFRPTREMTLSGTLACDFGSNAPPQTITAPLF
jgi:hypothetical protein